MYIFIHIDLVLECFKTVAHSKYCSISVLYTVDRLQI